MNDILIGLAESALRFGVGAGTVASLSGLSKTTLCRRRDRLGIQKQDGRTAWNKGKECHYKRNPHRAEKLIMEAYQKEARRLTRYDESKHWRDHPAALSWVACVWSKTKRGAELRRARDNRYVKERTNYALSKRLRCRIYKVLHGIHKSAPTLTMLGCPLPALRLHLESLFKPGMTWENYGMWEIDHKVPCASFDLSDPAQQRQCFRFSNLQPLWKTENRIKSDNIP